jgi:hypothetical protein
MNRSLVLTVMALAGAGLCAGATKSSKTSLTGCIDEQPGVKYVLRGDQRLRLIAALEPEGFKVENFAQYLGHKVVVTGSLNTESDPPIMNVKRIKRLASYCAPEALATPTGPAIEPTTLSRVKTETGCVDEQPGPRYVLRGDQQLKLLLELEPEEFPIEGFAKYLGQKVQVRGRTYTVDNRTVMRVREIKQVSGLCVTQPPPDQEKPK